MDAICPAALEGKACQRLLYVDKFKIRKCPDQELFCKVPEQHWDSVRTLLFGRTAFESFAF